MASVDALLLHLVESKGSDLLIATGSPPVYRIYGKLFRLEMPDLAHSAVEGYLHELLPRDDLDRLTREQSLDFTYEIRDNRGFFRFRCNAYLQSLGLNIVFRFIPGTVPHLADLGLPEAVSRIMSHHQGLVLVTGPSGSGKTTTLAALVNLINESEPLHIVTIEDPIEFIHPEKKSLVTQRQVGTHVVSFPHALRAALREDPDVIMVGELRDQETIQQAITASETGHLVLGTLNTNSASQTIDRIIDSFPPEKQPLIRSLVSDSLRGIISQQLIHRADGNGMVPAVELLITTASLANLIREGKSFQIISVLQTGRSLGMQTMDFHLAELVAGNIVTIDEAMDHAFDRKILTECLRKAGVSIETAGEAVI
ncbi:MAG: PilT/PilU family type 4a pilus ATPase [Candidatus Eremiobacteraeota bacterium]|nr:PilT/PilU family type 4a pilus ATPase [Candidatus Eremiobacteraeota bacterium]